MFIRFLQTSLVTSVLVAGLARADEPSPVDGEDESRRGKTDVAAESSGNNSSLPAKSLAGKTAKGQKPGKQASKARTQKGAPNDPIATAAEREEAVFAFVREHQPDLVELLERLKTRKAKEYGRAITELTREINRLTALRERDFDRYKLELQVWQLNSDIRLLTAKLSLEDRPELREEVKTVLGEHAKARMALKELERERLTARLKKVEADIAHFASQGDADLNRKFDRLMRAAERARGRTKPRQTKSLATKPVATKPPAEQKQAEPNQVETKSLEKNEP